MNDPVDIVSICEQVFSPEEVARVRLGFGMALLAHRSSVDLSGPLADLQDHWYESLASGAPDYGVYDSLDYVAESLFCWQIYSRNHLREIVRKGVIPSLGEVRRIADLGCGVGLTTVSLKRLFPQAEVLGTNMLAGAQGRLCREIDHQNEVTIVAGIEQVGPVDLVFASEYFEHFHEPGRHLTDVLDALAPRVMITANAFTATSTGHFPEYLHNGASVPGVQMSRAFGKMMRSAGFVHQPAGFWNNRPMIWVRPEEATR